MVFKTYLIFLTLLVTSQGVPFDNNCGEGAAKVCYGAPAGTAQNINLDDLAYTAAYLRYYGQSAVPAATLTIPSTGPFACAEWSLYQAGTVLVLAKHINPKVNTTVLFEDIANTIDGGELPTTSSTAKSILSCGINGGSIAVNANTTRPEYQTAEFKASKASTDGIVIKIVKAPA